MTNLTVETAAAARDLHAQHKAAANKAYRLTLAYAYGNGKGRDMYAAAAARDAIFEQMLALRGIAFNEWVQLNDAERAIVWGF